ncbi:lipoprotein LipO [Paenibacillus sp. J31TS4]|uniref:extracellular solute-binding protein n=1 Tax=Paenibacillus sp. J31TS4 TaxID=2807195 RepID=UPI001B28D2C3|nr:extracellular solute-binding protein [Paenibacillus sp. J31TS4]GIP40899.1 lipoprotein LipO [Paenibacillus sp. J31TS4]
MNKKKTLAVSLAAVMALTTAACSSSKPEGSAAPAPSGGGNAANKKFTVSMMSFAFGNLPPADGRGVKMINEKFNIDYKPTLVVQSDYIQKLSATIASGEVPDITVMEGADANFYKWAKQGAFLPLNDYIEKYPSFKLIPKDVLKAFTVNGKIYAIPRYYPINYQLTAMIRTDWLENLGLKMPTNYEELKQVALAFTKNDPDKNGKNDTYGIAMAQNINPNYAMGAYWDFTAWYHKNKDGQLIPGSISDAQKEKVAWMADLYKQGAITQDFAVMNWAQTNKEFYSGKAGIFIGTPRGMSEPYMQSLVEAVPNAKLAPVPPFVAPDGTQGFASTSGAYGMTMFSAKLAKEPEKIDRIMEMMDFGRKYYKPEEMNKSNPDFDWFKGNEGTGYKIVNGNIASEPAEKGLSPALYYPDGIAWAPNDEANGYSKTYSTPLLVNVAQQFEKLHKETKHYFNPVNSVFSETKQSKDSDLNKMLYDEQTKMIVGQRPLSDWDKMVKDYMDKGGAQIIKEVNDAMKEAGVEGRWKEPGQ